MKKRLLVGLLVCGLALPTMVIFAAKDEPDEENKSPTVTSPKGGESWKTGTTRVVKWSKGSGFNFVKIQLLKSGKHYKWVSTKTKNDGKHSWKIPSTIATSSAYKIKITATTNNKLTDTSNRNFTITKTGGGGSSLSVTTPNGGQKWKTGKKYAIKWNKGNAGAYVKIQLLKSGKHSLWISKKTKNDGRYTWTIPSSVATGSTYKVKIVSNTNKEVFDKSDANFTITKTGGGGSGSLTVTTPNGGQKWKTGKKYAIKWNKGNAGAYVKIQLLKSGKHSIWISKKTKNDGKHPWKVPSTVATGSAYKVKITSTAKKTVTDSSNSAFTITKSVTKCTDFHVDRWQMSSYSNPGAGKQRVYNLSSTKSAWLTLSCPYAALWYYASGEWHNYYNGFSYQDTGAALCVGNKVTYSDPKYEDNVCTITDVDNLN